MHLRTRVLSIALLGVSASCAAAASDSASTETSTEGAHKVVASELRGPAADTLAEQDEPSSSSLDPQETPPTIKPPCDEDNPIRGEARATDLVVPTAIVTMIRTLAWNCHHRQWHDIRLVDIIKADNPRDSELLYMQRKGWTRAAIQEGAPGNGFQFLAMHHAMVTTLKARFATNAALFKGWDSPPLKDSTDDPLPPAGRADPFRRDFNPNMKKAVDRIKTWAPDFADDDAFGLWVQTSVRWTAANPGGSSGDPTTSLHGYLHNRFTDQKSPISMSSFSRNIENKMFWRLHGFIDNSWMSFRAHKNKTDNDADFLAAMSFGCNEMKLGDWDATKKQCKKALDPLPAAILNVDSEGNPAPLDHGNGGDQ